MLNAQLKQFFQICSSTEIAMCFFFLQQCCSWESICYVLNYVPLERNDRDECFEVLSQTVLAIYAQEHGICSSNLAVYGSKICSTSSILYSS